MCVSQIIWLSWKRLELVIIVRKQFSSSLKLLFNKLRGEYAGRVVYVSGGSDLGKKWVIWTPNMTNLGLYEISVYSTFFST